MNPKNRVVVRYRTGRLLKGFTWDFVPSKESFHLADPEDERKVTDVRLQDLKAVFFVRSFEGDRTRRSAYALESFQATPGIKLKVSFKDGETLYGTTNAYAPTRKGFFLLPADPGGNNERVYIVADSANIEQVK